MTLIHSEESLLNWLAQTIARETESAPETIEPDKSIHTLGLDSAAAIALTFELQDHFSIEIDPAGFFEHASLRAFARSLSIRLNQV